MTSSKVILGYDFPSVYRLSSLPVIFAASFRLFDEDGNGELDRQEVERMLILVMKSMVPLPFRFGSSLLRAGAHDSHS